MVNKKLMHRNVNVLIKKELSELSKVLSFNSLYPFKRSKSEFLITGIRDFTFNY